MKNRTRNIVGGLVVVFCLCVSPAAFAVDDARDRNDGRRELLDGMQDAMGKLPDRSRLPDLDMKIHRTSREPHYTRHAISMTAAENEIVPALLYVPEGAGPAKKTAAILALHPTGELGKEIVDGRGLPNRAYAKELAERGYVVIAPDYPGFGELSDHDFSGDRYESGTMKGIFNHMRCVDLLENRDDVDPGRIGVIGHSLGGHNAMFVGAFDPRLKVIVSSCGWTEFEDYDCGEETTRRYGGRLGPWAQDRYMPLLREKYGLDENRFPFQFHDVVALLAPRPFFSNSPLRDGNFSAAGVEKGIARAKPAYGRFQAEEMLQVRYPDAGHDFPPDIRSEAYRFLDRHLSHTPTRNE